MVASPKALKLHMAWSFSPSAKTSKKLRRLDALRMCITRPAMLTSSSASSPAATAPNLRWKSGTLQVTSNL